MIERVSPPVKAKNNPFFQAHIFCRFFKILYRLDLFSIDFQNNVSFLKTDILGGAAPFNADYDDTALYFA
jgi:hypothetical protein